MQPFPRWAIVLHGGAGSIDRASLTPDAEAAHRDSLATALETGSSLLRDGSPALDAVESTILVLEDDPLFNAGRGAVFSAAGRNELDAAIMDGSNLEAGAVAGVTRTRNPISLARAVMKNSPHVLLSGEGAELFALVRGLEQVDPSFFFNEERWRELETVLEKRGERVPPRPDGAPEPDTLPGEPAPSAHEFGTVGTVALDSRGNLAAGTSTGGLTGKRWGRVGDSPLIGAGTYASNESCAVSGTGAGEYFIRLTIAHEICALVQYKCYSLEQALQEVIKRLTALGGSGGVIALSKNGEMAWSFNTSGMYRACASEFQKPVIAMFGE